MVHIGRLTDFQTIRFDGNDIYYFFLRLTNDVFNYINGRSSSINKSTQSNLDIYEFLKFYNRLGKRDIRLSGKSTFYKRIGNRFLRKLSMENYLGDTIQYCVEINIDTKKVFLSTKRNPNKLKDERQNKFFDDDYPIRNKEFIKYSINLDRNKE